MDMSFGFTSVETQYTITTLLLLLLLLLLVLLVLTYLTYYTVSCMWMYVPMCTCKSTQVKTDPSWQLTSTQKAHGPFIWSWLYCTEQNWQFAVLHFTLL